MNIDMVGPHTYVSLINWGYVLLKRIIYFLDSVHPTKDSLFLGR